MEITFSDCDESFDYRRLTREHVFPSFTACLCISSMVALHLNVYTMISLYEGTKPQRSMQLDECEQPEVEKTSRERHVLQLLETRQDQAADCKLANQKLASVPTHP